MDFNKFLGLSNIHNFDFISRGIKKNYNLNGEPTPYSCNFEMLGYKTSNKYFNNSHKLFKLVKKKHRLGYSGFIFKSQIKNNNKLYYKNIFMKEIPLYPANINYYNIMKSPTLSYNEYRHNYFKYNTDSSCNIEIFLSYVCSRLFELKISPSFCLFYGHYNVNLKYFSYLVDKDTKSHNCCDKIYRDSNNTVLRKNNCPIYLLALEKLDFDIFTIEELCELDLNFFKSLVFQLYSAVFTMFTIFGIKHNDLHTSNLMFNTTNKKFIYYKFGDSYYKVPTHGFIVKIIDWGRGVYRHNLIEGKNSVFNKNTVCENQLLFTRINKTICNNYDWSDIVILTQNILYNFPQIKDYPRFHKFLKDQIKTTKGIFISTKTFNWETYENIARNKFNIYPSKILNNIVFKNFITKEKNIKDHIFDILL